jgi:hypothetical protein
MRRRIPLLFGSAGGQVPWLSDEALYAGRFDFLLFLSAFKGVDSLPAAGHLWEFRALLLAPLLYIGAAIG